MLTFIDWFAGIGGFRRGMELAGHKCVGFCEYDKFAVKSYRVMHDTEGEWFANDVRAVKYNDIPKSDVWCFGFPCQDISVAGKQKGMREGTRSGLFYTITSLLRKIEIEDRPGTLFIENVKNLLSINGGWDFAKVIIELDEVGYDCEWQLLNSKNFGVPQNRERVFIIGHLRGRSRQEVFPIGEPNETTDIKVIGTTNPDRHSSADIHSSDGIMSTICGRDYKQPKQIAVRQIGNTSASECNPQSGRVYSKKGISPTLDTCEGGNRMPKIAIPVLTPNRPEKRQNGRRFKEDGEEMFTLTAQDRHGVAIIEDFYKNREPREYTENAPTLRADRSGLLVKEKSAQNLRIRKLTPLECFRLQGWSDDYFYRAASVNSDSQLYKQAGNGVTVNVIYEIAKRL